MALPHYKLHTANNPIEAVQSSFPVVLVPPDPPRKTEVLKAALQSRKALSVVGTIAVLASAAFLWILLDPQAKEPNLRQLTILAAIIGTSLVYFLLAAWAGKQNDKEIATAAPQDIPLPVAAAPQSQPARNSLHNTQNVVAAEINETPATASVPFEVHFEEWTSGPYLEIIDDSVITSVFNDDLIAPDHLVFSIQADE